MLICATGAVSLWFLSLGWRWSPHGSELQWEALAVGEISIKIERATKASGNPPPPRKRSRNPPPGSTCKSVQLQERVGWGEGGGSTNQQDSISSAGAECCSEFILIHHTDEESLRMKTNPVKIYFTLRSSLIWITPSAALHQQGEATCCRAICCCYLMEKKKLCFFLHTGRGSKGAFCSETSAKTKVINRIFTRFFPHVLPPHADKLEL